MVDDFRRPDHGPPTLEVRVAITDAEVVQAIGCGRGINRTADNPLAVFQ
jgi:hypothetical protein